MAARASWKGHLKVGDLVCAVGLYTAVSVADRISFNIINRKTGHRVERQFVDSETGKPVERDDQVKGYRLDSGDYVMIEGEELPLVPGMCFSVEPGIYLPGRFGVRIEDIVTVTADGSRRLNATDRGLRVVG